MCCNVRLKKQNLGGNTPWLQKRMTEVGSCKDLDSPISTVCAKAVPREMNPSKVRWTKVLGLCKLLSRHGIFGLLFFLFFLRRILSVTFRNVAIFGHTTFCTEQNAIILFLACFIHSKKIVLTHVLYEQFFYRTYKYQSNIWATR